MTEDEGPRTLVLMGVSGSGKSTLAAELAARLGWPVAEGDAFHPPANVAKMAAGEPLDDADRLPWLQRLADWVGEQEARGTSSLVTCSALRRSYRDLLCSGHPSVRFLHLDVERSALERRLARRTGHFMPASLLESQLLLLERLEPDEPGTTLDADVPLEQLVEAAIAWLCG